MVSVLGMKIKKRNLLIGTALVLVVLLGLFAVYGVPFVQDLFAPPVTGLPTTSAANSLRARYTQTALAKTSTSNATETPQPK